MTNKPPGIPRPYLWWTIGIIVLGFLLVLGHALTKIPHIDEGDLASAAVSLLERGRIAFPISYSYDLTMRTEYFVPPFYPATLAGWFAAFGSSIQAWRLFHVLWLGVLIAAWIRIVRISTLGAIALPLSAAILALNYDLLNLSVSRYDIVCAALNGSAMAAYVSLRRSRFGLSLFLANTFLALSALSHPYAIFGLFGTLAIAFACGDWRRFRPVHVGVVLLPYAIGFGIWALIIGGQWDTFLSQMTTASGNKKVDLTTPFTVFTEDAAIRWWRLFAGWREGVPGVMRAKTIFLLIWPVVAILVLRFGSESNKGIRTGIVLYTLFALLTLPFSDSMHVQIYNLHVIVGFLALTSIAFTDLWPYHKAVRSGILGIVMALSGLGVAGIGLRVLARDLQREYSPAISILQKEAGPRDIIIGPSELAFGLGFDGRLRDDPQLTSIESAEPPSMIIETRDRGLHQTPSSVECRTSGPPTTDTLTYLDLSPSTPRGHYRILKLDQGVSGVPKEEESTFVLVMTCRETPSTLSS